MPIESYTENIVLNEMKCNLGVNSFGHVYPQGSVPEIKKVEDILKLAGGKPDISNLNDYNTVHIGKAKPEFIITFKDNQNLIIVIECKNSASKHSSVELNRPKHYAVDGVLYYAKYLKNEYDVIAIAVSGTSKEKLCVSTFQWLKNQDTYLEMKKAKDIILEPQNYLKLYQGEKIQKEYSLEEIRSTALDMHNKLREIKVPEKHKPIFIAGILIALENPAFSKEYQNYTSFNSVINNLIASIDDILENSDIKRDKIQNIKNSFRIIKNNEKLKQIPLGQTNSITWYIEQLEMKIKPMMDHTETTLDALGVFYHEFVKYSGGDGSGLGIVLTPQHLTEFMVELASVNKNSRVADIACGSGSFLVTAMSKMVKDANPNEILSIKRERLFGVELDPDLYTLAIANMIIRKDGKSNIIHGDCFNKSIESDLKSKNINIGLLNPPYSQKDKSELEFTEQLLDILVPGGKGVVVVPMSCAIGTKHKEVRHRLFKKHTLKAVFSMPDDIFYPTGTNVCVMLWEAHKPHDSTQSTYFGYFKNDGFQKRKKLGRVDVNNSWNKIKASWIKMYNDMEVKDGLSAKKSVKYDDEWLCEAYMMTDYSQITINDFQITINDYMAYLIKSGEVHESK